jgi:hypothetical protein
VKAQTISKLRVSSCWVAIIFYEGVMLKTCSVLMRLPRWWNKESVNLKTYLKYIVVCQQEAGFSLTSAFKDAESGIPTVAN